MANGGRVAVFNPNIGIVDRGQIGAEADFIDPYAFSTTQEYPIGTQLQIGTRVWNYALIGAVATVAGKTYQTQVIEANGDVTDMAIGTPGIGDLTIVPTNGGNTAIVADEYKDGYVLVQDDTGEGYAYQIKGNDASAINVAFNVYLYDSIKVALGAGATVALTHPVGYKVVVAPAGATARLVGTSMGVGAAASYGWFQCEGPAAVLHDGTTAPALQGGPVRASEDDIGGVALEDGADNVDMPHVGIALHVTADGEYLLVDLQI